MMGFLLMRELSCRDLLVAWLLVVVSVFLYYYEVLLIRAHYLMVLMFVVLVESRYFGLISKRRDRLSWSFCYCCFLFCLRFLLLGFVGVGGCAWWLMWLCWCWLIL